MAIVDDCISLPFLQQTHLLDAVQIRVREVLTLDMSFLKGVRKGVLVTKVKMRECPPSLHHVLKCLAFTRRDAREHLLQVCRIGGLVLRRMKYAINEVENILGRGR